MVDQQDVEFRVEGDVTLRAWLFLPDQPGPRPAITMAHGYAGIREHGLDRFGFRTWLDALDTVEALQPRPVVAGHKNRDLPDDPAILAQTRQYLLDAQRLLDDKPTPRAYFDRMLALHPDHVRPGRARPGSRRRRGGPARVAGQRLRRTSSNPPPWQRFSPTS